MELSAADLIRTAAQVDHDALQVVKQLIAAKAKKEQIEDAWQNSENAARLLRLAIERWMRTL